MQTVKGDEKFTCFLHMHVDQKTDQQVPFSTYIFKKRYKGIVPSWHMVLDYVVSSDYFVACSCFPLIKSEEKERLFCSALSPANMVSKSKIFQCI